MSDTVGKECGDTEVDHFFFTLVLQDQNVTGLDERPLTWVIDRRGQVNFDGHLFVACRLSENEQTSRWHVGLDTEPTAAAAAAAATATATGRTEDSLTGQCHRGQHIQIIVARQTVLSGRQQTAGVVDFRFTRFDVNDVASFESDIIIREMRNHARFDPQRNSQNGRVLG